MIPEEDGVVGQQIGVSDVMGVVGLKPFQPHFLGPILSLLVS